MFCQNTMQTSAIGLKSKQLLESFLTLHTKVSMSQVGNYKVMKSYQELKLRFQKLEKMGSWASGTKRSFMMKSKMLIISIKALANWTYWSGVLTTIRANASINSVFSSSFSTGVAWLMKSLWTIGFHLLTRMTLSWHSHKLNTAGTIFKQIKSMLVKLWPKMELITNLWKPSLREWWIQ